MKRIGSSFLFALSLVMCCIFAASASEYVEGGAKGVLVMPESLQSIAEDAFAGDSSISKIIFQGDAPVIDDNAFRGVTAEVWYPANTAGWDAVVGKNFDRQLSWKTVEVIANGSCGDHITWTLDSKGLLTISGTGSMENYLSASSVPWYNLRNSVESVFIEDGVTSIGRSAFSDCSNLTSINISDSVTSIGSDAFYYCRSLTSIIIPDSVTSIGSFVFYYCSSLTSITIPDSVTNIDSYAFYSCSSLTSINIPNGITSIGSSAFSNCSSLTSITIPDSVTSIGSSAFSNCSSLTSINIPDSVTSIGSSAFSSCGSLTSINIPDSVTSIGSSAFSNCSSLTSINIPDSVTSIGSFVFYYCSSLTSIKIPDSVTSIGDRAFEDCSSLTSINIPDSVTSIGSSAFNSCSSLTSINIPYGITNIGDRAFNNCRSLTSVNIPDGVTSIGEHTFRLCSKLTSINIPDSVTSIGDRAFEDCSSLTSISIPNSVTNIGNDAFSYCSNLISINIPDGVTSIGESAFYYCSNLTSINIPDSVTSIGRNAFYGCRSLTSINIPDSVTSIGWNAFYGCRSLTSINIPDSVTSIDRCTFEECSSLTSIIIPESVTSIGENAFYYCSNLTSIIIPESVTSIGSFAFYHCSSLTSIKIPDGVTSIGGRAFDGCSGLTSIIIPESATSIDNYAFSGCSSLTDVFYSGTEAQWQNIQFGSGNTLYAVKIHYNSAGFGTFDNLRKSVKYFARWDADKQTAYFGSVDELWSIFEFGSQISEQSNPELLKNIEQYVGQYVVVDEILRTDGMLAPDMLINISPVATRIGFVRKTSQGYCIEVDGVLHEYVDTDMINFVVEEGERVVCHMVNDEIVSTVWLDIMTVGYYSGWNSQTRVANIGGREYYVSDLIDAASLDVLNGQTQNVLFAADSSHIFHVEYAPHIPAVESPALPGEYGDGGREISPEEMKLFKLQEKYDEALLQYLSNVESCLENFSGISDNKRNSIIEKEAMLMMNADLTLAGGYITGFESGADYRAGAYKAYAASMYDYTSMHLPEFGTIKLTDQLVGAKLVNSFLGNVSQKEATYEYDGYRFYVSYGDYFGLHFGTIKVYEKHLLGGDTFCNTLILCSTKQECEKVISDYLEELEKLGINSQKNVVNAIYQDILGQPISKLTSSYIDQVAKRIENRFAISLNEVFKSSGAGNVIEVLNTAYSAHAFFGKALNVTKQEDALNMLTELKNLKFEDSTIARKAVKSGLSTLKKSALNVIDGLEDYYGNNIFSNVISG